MARLRLGVAILLAMVSVTAAAQRAAAPAIDPAKVIDLTYSFDEHTVYWPTAQPFHWEKEKWGATPAGWYAAARYSASEHGGTHLDSPVHFAEGKQTVDQIPVSHLVARAALIDVSAACAANTDYRLTPADVAAFEKAHGRIAPGTVVLVRTGWGRFWPDRKKYLGTDTPGDTANLHFPGISAEAAQVLASRNVAGIGIDTASMDYGPSKDFVAHRVINGANVYGLENVANLDKVPATGATIIALPMKIGGGSGAPTRIIAVLP